MSPSSQGFLYKSAEWSQHLLKALHLRDHWRFSYGRINC